jgi:signal transduction histidine kinase
VLAKYAKERDLFSDYCLWVWLVAFVTGIAASGLAWRQREGRRGIVLALLAVASVSVVFVNRWWPSHLGGLPLVFVAWEAAQILSLKRVVTWIAAQTVAFGLIMVPFSFNHPKHPIPLSIWLANTLALAGLQAFAVLAAHLMRRASAAREELALANRELLATRELAIHGSRAAERLDIARDLHDVLGHHLSALSLNLEAAALERGAGGAVAGGSDALDTARSLTRTTLAEVRSVVSRLRKDDATDLSAALAALVAAIPEPAIHLRVPDDLPPVDAVRALAILRCAQECVTNAIRHSGAKNLWIELVPRDGGLDLSVRDDGQGAAALAEGNGLAGMRERLVALQGKLSVFPGPPGFEARVWVP